MNRNDLQVKAWKAGATELSGKTETDEDEDELLASVWSSSKFDFQRLYLCVHEPQSCPAEHLFNSTRGPPMTTGQWSVINW